MIVTLSLPHKVLSPNSRAHWRTIAAKKKAYRAESGWAGKVAGRSWCPPLPWKRVVVQPVFYWPDKRRRDGDNANASLKSAIDGLQDAGIIEDDSGVVLKPPIFYVDPGFCRVELQIASLAAEAKP